MKKIFLLVFGLCLALNAFAETVNIPSGGGTFYSNFNHDATEYSVTATPASGCKFVKNPDTGNGWTGITLTEDEATAKFYGASDPLKSPGFFGKAVYGNITKPGTKPGTPPPWEVVGDRINIHSDDEYVMVISPWGAAVSFETEGGTSAPSHVGGTLSRTIQWKLVDRLGQTVREVSGTSFQISEGDFTGANPIPPGIYKLTAKDDHGASDEMSLVIPDIKSLTVSETGNESNKVIADESNPAPDKLLYVCETSAKNAKIKLGAEIVPEGYGEKILWEIDGDYATPSEGNFSSKEVEVTLDPYSIWGDNREFTVKAGCDKNSDGGLDSDEVKFTIQVLLVKDAPINGYVYGESSREIADMQNLPDPANVVASGYMKFETDIEPADKLYFKWSSTGGTLIDPEGAGDDHLEVKWDAPDGHKTDVTLTLEIMGSDAGPVIRTKKVKLKTIRPYVVRVRFVDDTYFFDEEQQIADGAGAEANPEFDAIAGKNSPVCYIMKCGMETEVDVAGDKTSDSTNNLSVKTPIRITTVATYGGISNKFDETTFEDNTDKWSTEDYDEISLESDDNLPKKVFEYEDFEMHWTFKVKRSSGDWVNAYEEETGYSQKTEHKETAGGRTYGLYTIYDDHKFNDDADFKKLTLDYACKWAKGESSENPILNAILSLGFEGEYHYTTGGNCWYLAKEFDHASKALGIESKLHKWSRLATPSNIGDMVTMYPNRFEPVGPLTWALWQASAGDGSLWHHGWGYHEWVEANGIIFDPSAGVKQPGSWGKYEDKCFDHYYKLKTAAPLLTFEEQKNQKGQSVGCESDSHRIHIDGDTWPIPDFKGPPFGY